MATGTVTVTEITHTSVKKIAWAWTATAGGAAGDSTTAAFDGDLIGLATIPDGVAAPTDNYDIVITDADSHDVLLGAGANRDTATTEYVAGSSLGAVSGSRLTLAVTNAGSGGKGVTILWIR